MSPAHIHKAGDGLPRREVFLNGVMIKNVVFADTRKGVVEKTHAPIKIHKHGKRVRTFRLRGVVEVIFA